MANMKAAYCRNCDRQTLHFRDSNPPNHLLHILLTLFLCGTWVFIWILLIIFQRKSKWRCSECGHQLGKYSDREAWEDEEERLERTEQKRLDKEAKRAERERLLNDPERIAAAEAKAQARREALASAKESIVSQIKTSVYTVDSGLKYAAGDDVFMHTLFRILLVLVMFLVLFFGVSTIGSAIWNAF